MTEEPPRTTEWDIKKSDKDKAAPSPELQKIFDFILTKFTPAEKSIDADLRMTTDEVHRRIISFFPDYTITPLQVFSLLEKANFKYDTKPGTSMEFFWLIKKKT
jgi:hypothetical protein